VKLLLIKFYLQVIVMLQSLLLNISKLAMFLYKPLPTMALNARLLIEDMKNERTMGRKVPSKDSQ
jgi:hypothetical protein